MSSLKVLEPLFRFLPEVKSPVHHEDFNEKLKWTALILVLYFILTEIPLYGLSSAAVDQFAQLRAVMAGRFGFNFNIRNWTYCNCFNCTAIISWFQVVSFGFVFS